MNARRNNARWTEEDNVNEGIPPQDPEKPQVPIEEGNMSNIEIREGYSYLDSSVSKVSRYSRVQVNTNASTIESRIKDFMRMNPPTFFGSKVEDYSWMKCSKC